MSHEGKHVFWRGFGGQVQSSMVADAETTEMFDEWLLELKDEAWHLGYEAGKSGKVRKKDYAPYANDWETLQQTSRK